MIVKVILKKKHSYEILQYNVKILDH